MENQLNSSMFRIVATRYKTLLAVTVLLALCAAALWLYLQQPAYRSKAVIEQRSENKIPSNISLFPSSTTGNTSRIISRSFLTQALKDKELNVEYYIKSDYRTITDSRKVPFTVSFRTLNKGFYSQSYDITFNGENEFTLLTNVMGLTRTKTGTIGEEIIDNNIALTVIRKEKVPYLSEALFKGPDYSFRIYSDKALADAMFTTGRTIEAAENNGVITITCEHPEAARTTKILDAVINEYSASTGENGNENAGNELIDKRIEYLGYQMSEKEKQIAEYKRQNHIIDISQNGASSLELLNQLKLQKADLHLQMTSLNNLSNYLRKNRDTDNSLVEYGAITDPGFAESIKKINEKYREKATTSDPSQLASIEIEIENLKTGVSERVLNTRKQVALQIEQIDYLIGQDQRQLSFLPEKQSQLEEMNRGLELDKKVYDLLVEKRASYIVDQTYGTTGIRILEPAKVPVSPVTPNIWLTLVIALISGFVLATLIASIHFRLTRSKRIGKNETLAQTDIPHLGQVPNLAHAGSKSYMDICTRIFMQENVKTITVSSSVSGEGKTFIASRLAESMALMNKKVLLLDMNIHTPGIETEFNITPRHTLSDVVDGTTNILQAVTKSEIAGLDIISAGQLKAGINSLLITGKTSKILTDLKEHYDIILIDTPGTVSHIDAIPLMKLSDLNLFIIRPGVTTLTMITEVQSLLQDFKLENLYFITNNARKNTLPAANHKRSPVETRHDSENTNDEESKNTSPTPGFLRRIALWFY